MRYLIILILLSGCGSKHSSVPAASTPAPAACANGALSGVFETTTPGTTSILAVSDCNFTLNYGTGCQISGTITNQSNDHGPLSAVLTEESGPCGGIASGTCEFDKISGGIDLTCASLYIDAYFEAQ